MDAAVGAVSNRANMNARLQRAPTGQRPDTAVGAVSNRANMNARLQRAPTGPRPDTAVGAVSNRANMNARLQRAPTGPRRCSSGSPDPERRTTATRSTGPRLDTFESWHSQMRAYKARLR